MNKKKISLLIAGIIMMAMVIILPNKVKAANNLSKPVYFGIQEYREGTTPKNMGYAIGEPNANGSTTESRVSANIWQIVKYNNNQGSGNYNTGNFYCVRAGIGFSNTSKIATYNISYDLKNDKNEIKSSGNKYLKKIVTNGYYNNLLALTDLLYLKDVSTDEEKEILLQNAGINKENFEAQLTDSDIEAVQQAAIWYFTNHDDATFEQIYDRYDEDFVNNGKFNGSLSKNAWLLYRTAEMEQNGKLYTSLSSYGEKRNSFGAKYGDGIDRNTQAMYLYNYLIYTANQNASAYANGTASSNTKVTLYANKSVENTQPIIIIEREKNKEFDLALRKYITKVDGVELSGSNSRKPSINGTALQNGSGTTAEYKHRKDPVLVSTGSIVTYNLTVYNEGEKEGRATKIIDQLPTGLKFSKINTEGFDVDYNESTNKVVITRKSDNKSNIPAYTKGNLAKAAETIEIECEVTANANTNNDTILTNIAWIAEEYDAVDKITITNQEGKDRDSTPDTHPEYNKDNMTNYIGNNNKSDLSDSQYYYKGQEDDDDFEKLILEKLNDGTYNVVLVKEDQNGEQLNSKATFEVNGVTKEVTGKLNIANNVKITSENVSVVDNYVIKEIVAPDEYCKFDGIITVSVTKKNDNGVYKADNVTYTVTDSEGNDITNKKGEDVKVYLNKNGNIYVEVKNYQFDLKLVKRIVEVNGVKVPERIENVDITNLANGTQTTADYQLNKNPVSVKKGDIVKYTLRVYNEGSMDGYASEISEDIPEGLEFVWSEKTDSELDNDTTFSDIEKEAIKYNQLRWDVKDINKETNRVEMITTDYLAKGKGADIANDGANLIKAFDSSKEYKNTINDKNPDYKEISVFMKVVSEDVAGTIIRNEAAITNDSDKDGNPVDDRDSTPEEWVKYEDDEDFDNIVLQSFDLALRKFIIAVSNDTTIEEKEYLKNESGLYNRAPVVDTSKLNSIDENGKVITTAIYNHTKEPVEVAKNDIVVYMLRVYNEGDIDGYATEIKDHLPPYLEFVKGDFNNNYGWTVSEDGRTVTTKYLEDQKINAAELKEVTDGENQSGTDKYKLSYKEVPIMCKVTDKAEGKITNIADITDCKDVNKKSINDRDSQVNNVILPSDKDLPSYKDDETGSYVPGQQDDDDFEKVIVKTFDLALRKFITAVNEKAVTTRIPEVKYDKDNNKITYEHTKEPVDVVSNNIVTYTIRVFNEGEINGFASKVSDDIPDGLEFLPENDLNKEYRWIMYDKDGKETTDVSKAEKITTDYLSKEQGEERMKKDKLSENPALLNAFDKDKEISDANPDYADVKVAFKVIEPNGSDKIIINSAQISDDTDEDGNPVDDIDSTPDEWIEGEDDQDKEYIKLTEFDLALRKWVTHAIVIENGKETVTQTGHKAEDDPEQVVKVELNRKKLSTLQVKFKYSIRVTNEGDIAGYAKEITDYIPAGLKFVAADNPDWVDEGNNVISTRKLENTLLQPGDSAEVTVTLTWINGANNLGLKTNIAEISEDYNDSNIPDRDSTPDNKVPGEDDIDDAPVLLSISTGRVKVYLVLGLGVLITMAAGITLIKKYVL